jgi:adenosylcobyric acid synthase
MNPILLKPVGDYRSQVILRGKFYREMHAREYYEKFILQKGLPLILNAFNSLREENDIVVIEGAGSPAEINISKYDAANMLFAEKVSTPVIICSDIERGGCFASIVGTMKLLKPIHRDLVKGFLVNKFRGDRSFLQPGIKSVEKITKKQVLGVIPKINFHLPNEDSLNGRGSSELEQPKELWNWHIDMLAKVVRESVDMQEIIAKVIGMKH